MIGQEVRHRVGERADHCVSLLLSKIIPGLVPSLNRSIKVAFTGLASRKSK